MNAIEETLPATIVISSVLVRAQTDETSDASGISDPETGYCLPHEQIIHQQDGSTSLIHCTNLRYDPGTKETTPISLNMGQLENFAARPEFHYFDSSGRLVSWIENDEESNERAAGLWALAADCCHRRPSAIVFAQNHSISQFYKYKLTLPPNPLDLFDDVWGKLDPGWSYETRGSYVSQLWATAHDWLPQNEGWKANIKDVYRKLWQIKARELIKHGYIDVAGRRLKKAEFWINPLTGFRDESL